MPDTKALKELLPEIEKQEGQWDDELFGRFLCAAHGTKLTYTGKGDDWFAVHRKDAESIWFQDRSHCPDVSLDAADKLCGELLPKWKRQSGDDYEIKMCELTLWSEPAGVLSNSVVAEHPTSEPTAICLALACALIAEGEG